MFDLINVLHITHPWGGGISTYIDDLEKASGKSCKIYTIKSWQGFVHVTHYVDGHAIEKVYCLGEDLELTDFTNEKYLQLLTFVIEKFEIDIVHIDSQVGHTFDIFIAPKLKKIPIVCTIHDFFYICPTFHLVDSNGEYCNICNIGEEQYYCLKNHEYLYSRFDRSDLIEFRSKFKSLIKNVDVFVFPSNSTKEIFSKFYHLDESICRVIYHGTSLTKKEVAIPERCDRNFRVGILGSMLKHKGQASVKAIMSSLESYPVEFYHFGDGDLSASNLTSLGRYEQGEILDLLHSKQIDVIIILSTWPETFSYTLTECFAANIPPIVTNMGALAERVSVNKIGWLVDYKDVAGISDLILRLSNGNSEVEELKQRICKVKLKTLLEMNQEYDMLYDNLLSNDKYINHEFLFHSGDKLISNDFECSIWDKYVRLNVIKVNSFLANVKSKAGRFISRS